MEVHIYVLNSKSISNVRGTVGRVVWSLTVRKYNNLQHAGVLEVVRRWQHDRRHELTYEFLLGMAVGYIWLLR